MSKIHRHQRPHLDFAKEKRLDRLFEDIKKESADECGEKCPMYNGGTCDVLGRTVNSGSDCELQRISREASRG